MPDQRPLILASGSQIRLRLLRAAGLQVTAQPAAVDEASLRAALAADSASPRGIADALAEMKAARVAQKHPQALVLGCDQVLEFQGGVLSKPETRAAARAQIAALAGQTHLLLSALVLYDAGRPVWRHLGEARLTMRPVSPAWLEGYLDRTWPGISTSVGGYKLEEEGIRLFSAIEGDYFTILGLPLLPLLSQLALRGDIDQ